MEQKRPADIIQELLDYLWNGLGLEEKGWKRLKKGDFKKKMKNGLTYQIWFDRSRYNYIDYEIGHGNVEVGFSCIIKQGDDYLYSFRIEPTTGGSFFRMLTEDLRLNTGLLDTFLPLVKANYLDFIDRFEADPVEALQPVCAPFTEAEDYSWFIYVREQMVERYGTAEQMEEYRRQAELRGTPGHKAKNWIGVMPFGRVRRWPPRWRRCCPHERTVRQPESTPRPSAAGCFFLFRVQILAGCICDIWRSTYS